MKFAIAALFLLSTTTDPATCPMHDQHTTKAAQHSAPIGDAKHGAEVDGRHDTLAPSHVSTRHSFRLFSDGGAIELRATDASDRKTIDAVRAHLREIHAQFVHLADEGHDFGVNKRRAVYDFLAKHLGLDPIPLGASTVYKLPENVKIEKSESLEVWTSDTARPDSIMILLPGTAIPGWMY